MRRFTLHVRLTKACNADCSYCSSWTSSPASRMRPPAFADAVDWLVDELLPSLDIGGPGSHATLEYVGGEILTVPMPDLRRMVFHARAAFARRFSTVRDGAQSNLIGSERKAAALDTLFDGRIGTSVDRQGGQRTFGGSADAYRAVRDKAVSKIAKRRGRPPGAIFVVDRDGLPRVADEIAEAERDGHSLVLRPVFDGGREVEKAAQEAVTAVLEDAFDRWAMRSNVAVEPFHHLLSGRLAVLRSGSVPAEVAACPFQRSCAEVSMDLEPDGTLYTCLDMADSGQHPLGNACLRSFDRGTWDMLRARKDRVDPKCGSCRWFASCQGGCMSQAIHDTGSPYGRPHLCSLWTALFRRIDTLVAARGLDEVEGWARSVA